MTTPAQISRATAWFLACRPKTLAAGIIPVIVGGALAGTAQTVFSWPHWWACLLGALLIQLAVNFANDAFDGLSGADAPDRLGPARAVASGWISARAMFVATALLLAAALVVGLWLTQRGGWPILALGVISLICAVVYTGGPFPLAHHGLGDLFVLVFFGYFAVLGTAWIQVAPLVAKFPAGIAVAFREGMITSELWLLSLPPEWWLAATAIGLQGVTIICVNNLRDRETDARVGKRTLAVRLGEGRTRIYYATLHAGACGCWTVLVVIWLPGLAVPALFAGLGGALLAYGVARTSGAALNGYLARSAGLHVITGLSAAYMLGKV